jgi:hypothetical protein
VAGEEQDASIGSLCQSCARHFRYAVACINCVLFAIELDQQLHPRNEPEDNVLDIYFAIFLF